MAFHDTYRRQVALLIRVLPIVAEEKVFALKGGTGINLFVREMPRLSVDIDLTYLPLAPRNKALKDIDAALGRIATKIERSLKGAKVIPTVRDGLTAKLLVRADGAQIKIEVTPVTRGTVFEPDLRSVVPIVEETFGFAEIQMVSLADLYAGKLVAALDRQHPRDLFDVRNLFAAEGIGDELRQAFLVYMISHDRPLAEVLAPNLKDLKRPFEREFQGMTAEPVTLDELIATRDALIVEIVGQMPAEHRRFLIGFKQGDPDWSLLGLPEVANLPAVRWKQQNLDKLKPDRRAELVARLQGIWSDT